jgi:hypothetical protein
MLSVQNGKTILDYISLTRCELKMVGEVKFDGETTLVLLTNRCF